MTNPIATNANLFQQILSGLAQTIRAEETSLSNILEIENEILRKARTDAANLDEFVLVNESVHRVIQDMAEVHSATLTKIQSLNALIQKMEDGQEGRAL